jgi:hypothetical protein
MNLKIAQELEILATLLERIPSCIHADIEQLLQDRYVSSGYGSSHR